MDLRVSYVCTLRYLLRQVSTDQSNGLYLVKPTARPVLHTVMHTA